MGVDVLWLLEKVHRPRGAWTTELTSKIRKLILQAAFPSPWQLKGTVLSSARSIVLLAGTRPGVGTTRVMRSGRVCGGGFRRHNERTPCV